MASKRIPYHISERDVEEHAASQSEDVGVGGGVLAKHDTNDQAQVTAEGGEEVGYQRLAYRHARVQQDGEVTCDEKVGFCTTMRCYGPMFRFPYCLVGLVVKASASGAEDPEFESRLR